MNKKIFVIVIIFSSIFSLNYIYKMLNPPEGMVYTAFDADELGFLTAMKSYKWGFKSPWLASEDSIFHNLVLGSNFLLAPLGFLEISGINLRALFVALKFLLAFMFYIAVYYLYRGIAQKKEANVAYIFFLLGVGLGGLFYLAFTNVSFLKGFVAPENYIYLIGGGSFFTATAGQLYLMFGLIFGYASLCMFAKNNINIGILFLGLSIFAYPFSGNVFFLLSFLYLLIHKRLEKRFFLAAVFYVPWIVLYLQAPQYFAEYIETTSAYTNLAVFFVYGGFVLFLALHEFFSASKKIGKLKENKNYFFVLVWGALLILATVLPSTRFSPVTPRYLHMVWVPVCLVAANAAMNIQKKFRITSDFIVKIVIAFSLPTIIVSYFFVISTSGIYVTNDEWSAINFLKNQPFGNVLSTKHPVGTLIPPYAEKRSMLGRMFGRIEIPLENEVKAFFSGSSTEIIKKYNITYVFFGPRETSISSFDPDSSAFLQKIFENNTTRIYKVISA